MSKLITRIKRLALALCFATPLVSWADAITAVNPVTGETETYTYKFIGTDTWDGTEYWQDSSEANPSGTPAKSGGNTWDPILFDGNTININAVMSVEGWNLRMGLYNGASVTMNNFVKYQGDTTMWMTVDETSQLNIGGFGGGNITDGQVIKLSVAKANGITWNVGLTSSNANNTFEYYLAGEGSVSYQGVTAANHKIKQADAKISGTSQVASKTLVTFTSTDKTFMADAAVVLKDNNGDELKTVYATSVTTADDTTLTGEEDVGTCELVQTTTGIVLYWVDGDPAALAPATVYKPSISINFTDSGNNLTTGADVGLEGYAVPGTSWNNFTIPDNANEQTFNTVNSIDSTGAASVAAGVSVKVSGHRGSYNCSGLTAASNPLYGYIDEGAQKATPTVTITGIPYEHYRVIVYHSTDTANVPFGYDTINGFNFTYVNGVQTTGTDSWGASGADQSAEPIGEGTNTLVSAVLSGDTVTMVAHRIGGATPSARGCFAAIQVVEYVPEVGENDLEIAVDGATEYEVNEAKELSGTVYLTGSGTLTLSGDYKITAATIDVGKNVVLNINADRLDATTFTGAGTVVYNNALPVTGKGWTAIGWSGTVWINGKSGVKDFNVNSYGNSSSTVKLSGVDGWVSAPANATYENTVPVILENGTFDYALKLTDGNSPNDNNPVRCTAFVKVSGSGTIADGNAANPMLKIYDASEFTGTITLTRARVVFCSATSTTLPAAYQSGIATASIYVDNGNSVTVPADKTWTAAGGFVVNGTLNANGTLASSHASKAVSGSGTVVFNGKLPSPTGDAWWKNSDWDGTVQIKSTAFTGVSGVATYLEVNKYGNDGSTLELNNCSGWLPVGNTAGDNVCTVPLKVTGTLTINDGYSGRSFTINKLSGSGAIYTTNNGATVTIQVLSADDFTGCVQLNKKRVVFGETIPATYVDGQIYVGSGFSLTVPNSNVAWYGTGGITVDGELRAAALSNLGGGTTITTTDNGVFTLLTASQIDDQSTSYARITGTGTLRYADGGSNNWRTLSQTDFPTGMICENNLSAGLILKTAGGDHTIGSLAGSGKVRSDWGSGDRNLKALQAKDTVYSGLFDAGTDRVGTFTVAPGASSAGTLTLSGTQTADNDLVIESGAAVNLTGTWVGATTVAGTFGGTGTLTGDLTFSDGATFKANASALTVSGTVTLGESLTIDASAIDADEVTIISSESITANTDVSKVVVNGLYTVKAEDGALKLATTKVVITVPVVGHATAVVTVGGVPVEPITAGGNTYKVAPGEVTVNYTADAGYTFGDGKTNYTFNTATAQTFELDESTTTAQYVAKILDGASYTSLQAAFNAVANNQRIVLLASTEDGATIPSTAMTFYFYAGEFTCGEIADAEGDFVTTVTDAEIEIDEVEVTAKKYRVAVAVAVVTIPNEGSTNYGDHMTAYNAFLAGPAGTTMRVIGNNPLSTDIACTEYDADTQTYTKLEAVASITVGSFTTNYPSLDDAIDVAEAGQKVVLLAATDEDVTVDKVIVVEAGAYEITGTITVTADGATVTLLNEPELGENTWILGRNTETGVITVGYGLTCQLMIVCSNSGEVTPTGVGVREVLTANTWEVRGGTEVTLTATPGTDYSGYEYRVDSGYYTVMGDLEQHNLVFENNVATITVTAATQASVTFVVREQEFTIPEIEHLTVTSVYKWGDPTTVYTPVAGKYSITQGTSIVIRYTPEEGYMVTYPGGYVEQDIQVTAQTTTIDNASIATSVKRIVAMVGDVPYDSLTSAISMAVGNPVTLVADTTENVSVYNALTLSANGRTITGTLAIQSTGSLNLGDEDAVLTVTGLEFGGPLSNGIICLDGTTLTIGEGADLEDADIWVTVANADAVAATLPEGFVLVPVENREDVVRLDRVEIGVNPEAITLNYNGRSQASVSGYPEGSTFLWVAETVPVEPTQAGDFTFDQTITPLVIESGKTKDTVKFRSDATPGTWHLTVVVTNNNEQIAELPVTVIVRDVAAVVDGLEYSRANLDQAAAYAVSSGEILNMYLNVDPDITLHPGQTLRTKGACDFETLNAGKISVKTPVGTASTAYDVNTSAVSGVNTYTVTAEEPSVVFTDGETTEYYTAKFKAAKAGTYKLLKDISRAQLAVGTTGVVLDLNGKTFTSTATGTSAAISVTTTLGSASLTITGEGAIVAPNYRAVQVGKNGSVAIESGALSGKTAIVYTVNGGTATISGGTFQMVSGSASSMLDCANSNLGTIAVTGGTFTGFNPANTADGDMVVEGYQSTETSTGVWTVTAVPSGIDPTDTEPTTVDVDTSKTPEEQQQEANEKAQDIPVGTTTDVDAALATAAEAAGISETEAQAAYQACFTKTAVKDEQTGDWVVKTEISEEVQADVNEAASESLTAAMDNPDAETVPVEVPAGLYYKIETFNALGGLVVGGAKTGLSNGTKVDAAKPTGTDEMGFIRIRMGAAPITD